MVYYTLTLCGLTAQPGIEREADGMPVWMLTASAIPQHMLDKLDLYLNGALFCMAGGLLLLIVAVVALKVTNRRADREK